MDATTSTTASSTYVVTTYVKIIIIKVMATMTNYSENLHLPTVLDELVKLFSTQLVLRKGFKMILTCSSSIPLL